MSNQNIDKVLEKDNVMREIPVVYRQGLELDISSEVANNTLFTSRDGVAMIRAMNAVRTALEGGVQLHGRNLSPVALAKVWSFLCEIRVPSVETRKKDSTCNPSSDLILHSCLSKFITVQDSHILKLCILWVAVQDFNFPMVLWAYFCH